MNYIIETKSKCVNYDSELIGEIENKIKSGITISDEELHILLDNLCYKVRCKFTNDIDNFNFLYKCDTAQAIIHYYLESIGIKSYPCMTQNVITSSIVGHSFITIEYNGKFFLIDPTYRQFLMSSECNLERFIIHDSGMILRTPDPGYYVRTEQYSMLSEFDYSGYHELNEEFACMYGDSFYNTKTGEYSLDYKTMNGKIYINSFSKGHEKLSKTKDELESMDLLVLPYNEQITL